MANFTGTKLDTLILTETKDQTIFYNKHKSDTLILSETKDQTVIYVIYPKSDALNITDNPIQTINSAKSETDSIYVSDKPFIAQYHDHYPTTRYNPDIWIRNISPATIVLDSIDNERRGIICDKTVLVLGPSEAKNISYSQFRLLPDWCLLRFSVYIDKNLIRITERGRPLDGWEVARYGLLERSTADVG